MKNFKRILATVLTLIMLLQTVVGAVNVGDFSDMPFGKWSEEAMTAAIENGLLKGYDDGSVRPDDNLSRAELAAIVTRAFGAKVEADISAVTDVKNDNWFYSEVAKAYQMGAVEGTSETTYSPESDITREAAFVILARVLCIAEKDASALDKFTDGSDVSDWAVESVSGLAKLGYVNGYKNGSLKPQGNITRAELAQLFHNVFKTYISVSGVANNVAPGSVIIRTPGVELKGVTINGDLIIADGVGNGNFDLTDVTVNGRIIVRGGEGKITFKNVTVTGGVIVNDPNGIANFNNYRSEAPFKNIIELTKATFLDDLTFTLTFETNGGSKIDPVSAKGGTVISLDKYKPKKSGYSFKGWYTDNETFKTKIESVKLASNMTVYAKWGSAGGGGGGGGSYTQYHDVTIAGEKIQVKDGSTVSQSWLDEMAQRSDLQIDGFTIVGWEKEDGTAFNPTTDKIKADIELFPAYMPLDTTVIFWKQQLDETSYSAADINSYVHEVRCNITTGSPVADTATFPEAPAGYAFAGWALKGDSTETIVTFPYSKPATALEFIPVFKADGTVIFYENAEGTIPFDTRTDVAYNSDVNAPATNPTLIGYTFAGWALKGDATSTLVTFPVKMPGGTLEFVPVFTINKGTVVFYEDAEGTIPFETRTDVEYDTDVNAPATNPNAPTGYTFEGWALKDDATKALVTFPVKMPDGALEFVPVYEVATFTVTFYADDNTSVKHSITSVPYGTTVDANDIPDTGLADEIGFDRTAYDTIYGADFIENQGLEEVHTIPYTWWYNNGTEWTEFNSEVEVTDNIDVYINSGYATLVTKLDRFGSVGLTLEAFYNSNIRVIDTLKDALFANTGVVVNAYNNVLKDKIFAQMIEKDIIDPVTDEILNQHRFIKLVDVLGKDRVEKMINEAVADYIKEDDDISQKLENYLKSIDDTNKADTKQIIIDAIATVVADDDTALTINSFVESKLDEMIDIIFPGGIPGFTYDPDTNSFEMKSSGVPGFEYDPTIPGFKLDADNITGFDFDASEGRIVLSDPQIEVNGNPVLTVDNNLPGYILNLPAIKYTTKDYTLPGLKIDFTDAIAELGIDGLTADYNAPGLKLDLEALKTSLGADYLTAINDLPGFELDIDTLKADLDIDDLTANSTVPGVDVVLPNVDNDNVNVSAEYADTWFGYTFELPDPTIDIPGLNIQFDKSYSPYPAYIPNTDPGASAADYAPEGFTWDGTAYVLDDIADLSGFDYDDSETDRAVFQVKIPSGLSYVQGSGSATLKINATIPSGISYANGVFTIEAPEGTVYDGVDTFVVNTPAGCQYDSAKKAFVIDTQALEDYGFIYSRIDDNSGQFKLTDVGFGAPVLEFDDGSVSGKPGFIIDKDALPGMTFVSGSGNECWFEINTDADSYLLYTDKNGVANFKVVVDLKNTELVNLVVDKLIDYVVQDSTDLSLFLELINEIISNLDSDQRSDLLEEMFPGDTSVKQQYQMVDEFTEQVCNNDTFIVKKKNLFIFDPMLKKLEDYTFDKLIGSRLDSRLLEILPIDIVETIYSRAYNSFIAKIEAAVDAAELDADDSANTYDVPTGLMIDINPVSDIIIPGMEYFADIKVLAEGKLEEKLDTYYKYYDENPYKDAIEYYLDPTTWFVGTDKGFDGELSGYSLLDFEDYYDLYKSFIVVADDAISWYYDNDNVDADDREIVYEMVGTKVVYIANMLNKYLVEYSVNGIPTSIADLVADLEEDPAMLEYLQNYGLDAYLAQISNNSTAMSIYDKLKDRFGDRLDSLLDKYTVTPFNRVYDDGEYEKAKDIIDSLFNTNTVDVFNLDSLFEEYFEDVDTWTYAKEGFELELQRMLFFIF